MLASYLLCAILTAPGDVELLYFSAPWCHACQESEPAVRKLKGGGFPVRHFNVDQRPDLARQFNVQTVPSFILVSNGKPIGRIDSAVTHNDLVQLVSAHAPQETPHSSPSRAPRTSRPISATTKRSTSSSDEPTDRNASITNPTQAAIAATVRLKIEDKTGHSYGTGTIIDVHGREALVLTCGHIFRDSHGKGRITVDLFAPGSRGPVRGNLLRYDLENDMALVSIRPNAQVAAARVALNPNTIRGDSVFSIGCNHGSEPTVMRGQVNAINRYVGPPANIVVSGQPVDGRSGGGLFLEDGTLIGVCQAADPEYKEGIYGHLPTVHKYLDDANLGYVYRNDRPQGVVLADTANDTQTPNRGLSGSNEGRRLESLTFEDRGVVQAANQKKLPIAQGDGTEVVCIVRSKTSPNRPSRVIVLDRPSNEFLQKLQNEQSSNQQRQLTNLRVDTRIRRRLGDH